MESDEIPLKIVHRIFDDLFGHTGVYHEVPRRWWGRWVIWEQVSQVGILKRVKRKVPPDMVKAGISPDYVFEPAGIDLVIIGGVAPTANTER